MKKSLFFIFLPFLCFAQIQIGADINGESAGDLSGTSVAISKDGTIVAIGAPNNVGNNPNSGHVRVYRNISGNWTQIGADINGDASEDFSGFKVALSSNGSIMAIGAISNDVSGSNSGQVKVFQNVNEIWTQIGSDINGESQLNNFGYSLALSDIGNILAIGANHNNGYVKVYKNINGFWTQIGNNIVGEATNDRCGTSVDLSKDGTVLAVGAMFNDGNGSNSGNIRVFKNINNVWTQLGSDIDGLEPGDQTGFSVSLSDDGKTIATQGYNFNGVSGGSGYVRVFRNINGGWSQIGSTVYGNTNTDNLGYVVSLSDNGTILAVSAIYNDQNGVDSGQVQVYRISNGVMTQIGVNINGEAAFDVSGWGMALSGDGTTIAIGARGNDDNGNNSGHVRVFDLSSILNVDDFAINNFIVFPNPVKQKLNIKMENNSVFEKVNLYNMMGQKIHESTSNSLDISCFQKGCYLLEVITDKTKETKRVVFE